MKKRAEKFTNRYIIEDLTYVAESMYDEIVNEKKEEVMFVGFYEDAIEMIKELMLYDGVMPHSLEIHDEEWDGYDKEYYISLDENLMLWCEPAMRKNSDKYLIGEPNVLFMTNDCDLAILDKVEAERTVEVVFEGYDQSKEDEELCDECCEKCCCHNMDAIELLHKLAKELNIEWK